MIELTQLEHRDSLLKRLARVEGQVRGIQAMIRAAKVEALLDNRKAVSIDDLRKVFFPALRHRLILNFEAQAEGVPPDSILAEILKTVTV